MDDFHPTEVAEPQRTLIVKLKVPLVGITAAEQQAPMQEQLTPKIIEPPRVLPSIFPQDAPAISAPGAASQTDDAAMDLPQLQDILSALNPVRESFTETANEVLTQPRHSSVSLPTEDRATSMRVASVLNAPHHDATTTAGAIEEFVPDLEYMINAEQPTTADAIRDSESDCIRVARPQLVDGGGPQPQPQLQRESEPEPVHRVSIAIHDLLRPVSEEPAAQENESNQIVAPNVNVVSRTETAYPTPPIDMATITSLQDANAEGMSAEEAGVSAAASPPFVSMSTPQADADMQEPVSEADIPATATNPADATQTPQTAKVIFRLSPIGMAKVVDSARDYGRERNTRRAATKAFGTVKTPERAAPKSRKGPAKAVKAVKAVKAAKANIAVPIVGATSRKRGAQSGDEPAATKRPKHNNTSPHQSASPKTRSGRAKLGATLVEEPADTTPSKDTAPDVEYTSPEVEYTAPKGPTSIPSHTGELRPVRDVEGDGIFARHMISVLKYQSRAQAKKDVSKAQSMRILELLEHASFPAENEALFMTTSEATELLAPGKFWNNIIITAGQQHLPLQSIDQFLGEFYEDDVPVSIQDPAARSSKVHAYVRQVKIRAIKERFAKGRNTPHPKPWNLLELATHHDDGLRPNFLNNEDCRLLTKLKIPGAADHSRRRTYGEGYKEVEKWALLAQAGALTEPHQDSHGYSTYITINVGLVGFGWLSSPDSEQRALWNKHTQNYVEGPWRYVVLKPGQTVYFPAGTVHFVFRLPCMGNTMAFGGHVLRCSNIVHWVKCLLEERESANVSNEDLTESAIGYLDRVERFVKQARKTGDVERWGGEKGVAEFLELKKEFLSRKQKT